MRYAYSLHEWAVLALVAFDNRERRELIDLCDSLSRSPGQLGTEQVVDETGCINEVTYTAHLRVTYWTDHALKEVRIMDVRRF